MSNVPWANRPGGAHPFPDQDTGEVLQIVYGHVTVADLGELRTGVDFSLGI